MSTKVKCDCGLTVNEHILEKHSKTKTHNRLIADKYRKINNYNEYKDIVNSCQICLKTHVADKFFIKDKKICICCDKISRGGEKTCKACKELLHVTKLERPHLITCKACAIKRLSKLKKCEICDKDFKIQHFSQHKHRSHPELFL